MAKFRAGKTSRARVNGQVLALQEWSTSSNGDQLDVANFESNGKRLWLTGLVGVDWSLKGDWDAAANPMDDPPGLYPRDDGVNADLYTKVADNIYWSFPQWACKNSDVGTTASGKVTFSASCTSQGDFTPPTGSV